MVDKFQKLKDPLLSLLHVRHNAEMSACYFASSKLFSTLYVIHFINKCNHNRMKIKLYTEFLCASVAVSQFFLIKF